MNQQLRVRRRPLRRLLGAMLWALPSLSALLAVAYVAAMLQLGTNPPATPIRGDSMNPLLFEGDLAYLQKIDPAQLQVGDVIGIRTSDLAQSQYLVPGQVVHRITEINQGKFGLVFTTKGDNNPIADPFRTAQQNVIGILVAYSPKLGYPFLYADTAVAKALGILAVFAFIVYAWLAWLESRTAAAKAQTELLHELQTEIPRLRDEIDELNHKLAERSPGNPKS